MSTQPPAPPIAPRRGGAEPPAQPLHATNCTPSRGGGTPGAPPPLIACTRFNNKTWQEYQTWLSAYQQSYEHIYQRPLKCIYGAPREISHKKIPPQAKILVIEMNNDENIIMGIGEIINQTASEVYRSPSGVVSIANAHSTPPSGVVSIANAHSTPPSGTVLNPAHNRTKFPPLGGGTPLPPLGGGTPGGHPIPFRKIFSDRNYMRYIYIGNTRYASREELERNHTPDAQYINEQLKSAMPQTPPPSNHPDPHPDPPSWGGGTPGGTPLERLLFKGARHMKRGSGITRCSVASLLHAAKPHSATSRNRASPLKMKAQPPQEREQPQREQPQREQPPQPQQEPRRYPLQQ